MNIKKLAVLGTVASCALLLAACKGYQTQQTTTKAPTATTSTTSDETNAVVISYSDSGFSPATVNAKVGQKVVFKNSSSSVVQVNSASHPTHTLFPMLNLGAIAVGDSKSVTFDKAGTYKYHNHLNASQNGTIVVQ